MSDGVSEPVSKFGALIRAYRLQAALTQRELAAKAGISTAAIRDFEQGRRRRPRSSSLIALADALGLDTDETDNLVRAAAAPSCDEFAPSPSPARSGTPWTPGPVPPHEGLWLTVLGPLEAWRNGIPLAIGPPARRTVLGLLAMDPGLLVRRERIIDVLWGESPPSTAEGLVQAHVSRLRKVLGPRGRAAPGGGVVSSVAGAYRLCLADDELDLLVFRDLAARAAAARRDGDDLTACALYEQSVALWRGDPLADVDLLSCCSRTTLLRQQLTNVLVQYADVACDAGQYAKVLPRLQAHAALDPMNELVHARLMLVLANSGQQAAAIRVYEDLRLRLSRELGLYPGDELAEAHLRVLRQDVRAGHPRRGHEPRSSRATAVDVVPRQLPTAPRHFTGRAAELAALSGLLDRDAAPAGGVVIAALTGMAGIGKTALAVAWAHRVAGRFPDGQLFIDLRGYGPTCPPMTSEEAIRAFLGALGVLPEEIPGDADGQVSLYRSLMAARRTLVVLDNARDTEQVRTLLPGGSDCLVLVTSRDRLTGLAAGDDASLLTLGALTDAAACDLLGSYAVAGRVPDESAVAELITFCAGLPLALCAAAAHAAANPDLPLGALAEAMRDERRRLDVLETRERATSVRTVFSWSHARLREPARRMFHLLGVHMGDGLTVSAAASLAGSPRAQTRLTMAELRDEHLVTEHAPGRFVCHDLLRAYAAELARTHESEEERRAAVHRVLDYYLRTADAVSAVLYPRYDRLTLGQPRPGVVPEEITCAEQAAEWFANERHALLAAISRAADDGYAPHDEELLLATEPLFRGPLSQERAVHCRGECPMVMGRASAAHHLGLLRLWSAETAAHAVSWRRALERASWSGRDQVCCGEQDAPTSGSVSRSPLRSSR